MRRSGVFLVTSLLIYALILCSLSPVNYSGRCFVNNANQALTDAEAAVGRAYEVVLDVDNAGGNITSLSEQLNGAVELLDEARRTYGVDQTFAEELANQAEVIADRVYEDALVLLAETRSGSSLWWILILLGVGSAIIFIGISLYYLWRSAAEEENKEVLEMEISTAKEDSRIEKE